MDGRREPTYTCSISRFAPYVRSPSGGHWIFYRIYLRLNRQRIGWSWVTDDSYRSTVDREADGSRRWMQSGWLRQQLGDRVGFCVYSSNLMLLDKLCMWVVSSWDGRSCLSSHFWCRRIESSDRIACLDVQMINTKLGEPEYGRQRLIVIEIDRSILNLLIN